MLPLPFPCKGYLGERMQVAYVVHDLDAAMQYWADVMKVGPFVVIEDSRGERSVLHRGQESDVQFTLAFAYVGDVQIELIAQSNDAPSAYKEFLDSGREGLHHIAFWPEDMDGACALLEENGFTEISAVLAHDGSRTVVYYQAPAHIGCVVELLPMSAARTAYYGRIQQLSKSWDGVTRPIRRFADRAAFLASAEGAESASLS
ncbi:VOC family protein [Sphingobium sp. EP60837]|uniref:VOC family protein n=1 Tax=Sphingobium sp. EP60837 TaxID=1855519 RepID=UPI0007DD83A8|nr:VOC family protein [Sphingobium sp. EP60837]ANI80138.1 Ribulose-bisphosphate carboxylase [Sphingobium sp. EP60837]